MGRGRGGRNEEGKGTREGIRRKFIPLLCVPGIPLFSATIKIKLKEANERVEIEF